MEKVSFAVYESMQTKDERVIKRLIVALIVCIVLLFASNVAWTIAVVCNGDSSNTTVNSRGGNANYIGHDGDINNGTNSSENAQENP